MSIDIQLIKEQFPALNEPRLLATIAEHGTLRSVEEGTNLIRIGQYMKFVPLVLSGLIKISREDEKGNEIFLYYLEAGDTCAMSLTCCLEKGKSNIHGTAEEDTQMITIPVALMNEWLGKYPSFRAFIMLAYAKRFDELLQTIDSITFNDMGERLVRYLESRTQALKTKVLHITHQQIAYDLNSSRESISRLLKKLEETGKIKLGRNKIEVLG